LSLQFIEMSSHTLLSDHCNSIPSSSSVIHSIEILASEFSDVMGTYRRLSHTVLSCIVSCVRMISEQDVWCWWLIGTDFR